MEQARIHQTDTEEATCIVSVESETSRGPILKLRPAHSSVSVESPWSATKRLSAIASTTTRTGLVVQAALDTNRYETAIKVSDEALARLQLTPHSFHGEWNYVMSPYR